MASSGSILGNPVLRREDPDILTGGTEYLDDLDIEGLLHVAFVRSTIAHARIESIDTDDAQAMPGVVGVYTNGDLDLADHHGFVMLPPTMNRPPLARDKVRFVGDIVAMIVAESKAQAMDAADAVIVDYDPLPSVPDMEAALEPDAPLIHEDHGSNVANAMGTGPVDGILDDADVIVTQRVVNQRLAAVPMEPNGMIAVPGDPVDGMTLWVSSQGPHSVRDALAPVLGLDPALVRARCAAVGGGFGPKQGVYVEFFLVAKAAQVLDRPVKWAETRSENMLAMGHGRAQVHYAELGLKRDGEIVGLRVRSVADAGAYPVVGAFLTFFTQMMSQQVYRTPKIEFNWQAALTNTTPTLAYRGAGRPEATHLVERMIDIAADELDLDPVEIRRKNFIPDDAFPYTTITGATYDSGEYDKPLTAVLEHAGYDALRAEQAARRERNDPMLLGIGLSCYVEITAPVGLYREWGKVEIEDDGTVLAYVGTSAHGQGHETAFSMIVSDTLGVPMDDIRIVQSDTKLIPQGQGTGGSRSLQIAGSALKVASDEVLTQAKQLAAHLFEANPDDVVLGDGGLQVAGVPARAVVAGPRASGEGRHAPTGEHGGPARARAHVRRGFVVVPVRRAHRGCRDRSRHRSSRIAAPHRGRRLRSHRQPDARRRPAARRHRSRCRAGALRARAVRRGCQSDHRQPHGLRDAVGRGAPVLRDAQHRDTEPAQSARRERHRRVGHDRVDTGRPQRDRRRAVAPRNPPRRHAVHRGARVARAAGSRR